jgi:ribosomal protein S18 acetylase RimI-like enzyme
MAALPVAQPRARSVTDREEIASFLRTDRRYAAYAIGDLDSAASGRCSWGIAYDPDGEPVGLAMHHVGLVPQPLFLMGEPAGCRAVLSSVIKPRDAFFQSTDALDAAAAELYDLDRPTLLLRMVVDEKTFVPSSGMAQRLHAADIDDLNRLYQLGFRAGFAQAILEDAIYYGIRVHGRLVSAAGTHVISRREGIAVVGNVMTHADYRGHGFAQMVTGAVTADLLEEVPDIALNVHADNAPAVAAYTRLGYREYCRLTERLGRRRSGGWGLMRPIREAMRITWPRDQR